LSLLACYAGILAKIVSFVKYIIPKYYVPNPAKPVENIFTPRTVANSDPTGHRAYTIYLGNEMFFLPSCPGNPVMDVIEEIYKKSIVY
jgi:hypothetical protein